MNRNRIFIVSLSVVFCLGFFNSFVSRSSADEVSSFVTITQELIVEETVPGRAVGGSNVGTVIIEGWSYPNSKVFLLKDGQLIADQVVTDGTFSFKLVDLYSGVYNFSLRAEDANGLSSPLVSYNFLVAANFTTTLGPIFLSPTLELELVPQMIGESAKISGSSIAGREVKVYLGSGELIGKTLASRSGVWSLIVDTTGWLSGAYTLKAVTVLPDWSLSGPSQSEIFDLAIKQEAEPVKEDETININGITDIMEPPNDGGIKYLRADFNKDSKVDFADFSILLFWLDQINELTDLDDDGSVADLADFSIFFYYWTG